MAHGYQFYNAPPGSWYGDRDGDAEIPRCDAHRCHSRDFQFRVACAGLVGPEEKQTCGHVYLVVAKEDEGEFHPASVWDCPACGYDDNDRRQATIECACCGAEAPKFCPWCHHWGFCSCDGKEAADHD